MLSLFFRIVRRYRKSHLISSLAAFCWAVNSFPMAIFTSIFLMYQIYQKVTNIQEYLSFPCRKTIAHLTARHHLTILIKQSKPFKMSAAPVHHQTGAAALFLCQFSSQSAARFCTPYNSILLVILVQGTTQNRRFYPILSTPFCSSPAQFINNLPDCPVIYLVNFSVSPVVQCQNRFTDIETQYSWN